ERMGIEELEREHAEQYGTRCDARAEDRHAVVGVAAEAPVDGLTRAPRRAHVDEECELGRRRGDGEEAELLRPEECKPKLEVRDRDAAAVQPVELRAGREAVLGPALRQVE